MPALLAAHLLVAALVPGLARRLPRGAWYLAALPPLAAVAWAAAQVPLVLRGGAPREAVTWAGTLHLVFAARLDGLSLLMVFLVSGVGALVLIHGAGYFHGGGREAGLLLAFAGVMFGLVTADDLIALYVFWELTSVISFLLIAGDGREAERRRAAQQALLTTVAGGLPMLFGLVLLAAESGTPSLSGLVADPPHTGPALVALLLVLLGAFTKSAQGPFAAWLPAAMVAPAPVSAYLHAAAMVKGGVYLVARLAPGFAGFGPWRPLVVSAGLLTFVLGAWQALRQTDLKLLLAHGTVSELGLLLALFGTGTRTTGLAGEEMTLAHAAFKSSLFLTVGALEHATGTRDARRLSGLGRRLPWLCATAVVSTASMAGLPPLIGYLGKEAAYDGYAHAPFSWRGWALAALTLGSLLTAAYSARFLWGAFARKPGLADSSPARPGADALGPIWLLTAVSLVFGIGYPLTGGLAGPYADAPGLVADAHPPYRTALWHGLSGPLLLSAAAVVLGIALHLARRPLAGAAGRLPVPPEGRRGYELSVRGVQAAAVWLTRHTQVGSLPAYLTVLLLTVVLVPGGSLLVHRPPLPHVVPWHSPVELPLALLVLACCAALVVIRHRLTAVLFAGAAGYAVGALFLVQGAPDLALTQFLVETLTVVIVVLVLRRLPAGFTPERPHGTFVALRACVAVLAGACVACLAVSATAVRQSLALSRTVLERAGETGSHNAVTALLLDFRALDTLGEISVLLGTAIAAGALLAHRSRRPPGAGAGEAGVFRAAEWDVPRERWLPEADLLPGAERSLLLEPVVRLLFPAVLLLSCHLLFAGHYRPGGGFAGGLVAGQACFLRYLAGRRAGAVLPAGVTPRVLAGGGLALAAAVALAPLAFGAPPLAATELHLRLPPLGTVSFATNLFFDIGVYLLVAGVCLTLLCALDRAEGAGGAAARLQDREPAG
ncbi:hydrogen gas-evolving membrane-bound hydrogenase subunit E [Streptomyces hoynatensis]|uniref:DUF4040 domain-containing protein n=1 Tax=Streptomyces hoynatensis TaxID=1141874 RepID=A0A3A9Z2L0_9ACTN|nr:hydrogen gas-evolving membrane-bound hydrogenase subunit E [Streptomyces hoynatensis]RKN42478.1 DUF4040 domain-containing protein [Streptomyces hoynatensis]